MVGGILSAVIIIWGGCLLPMVRLSGASGFEGLNWFIKGAALILASHQGQTAMVEKLLNKGADVNARTQKGTTALISAAGRGDVNTVRLLLGKGADFTRKDSSGKTALAYAMEKNQTAVVEILREAGARE